MRLSRAILLGLVLLAAAVGSWSWMRDRAPDRVADPQRDAPAAQKGATAPQAREPTLYCEFTNFADRNPLVGFYFLIEEAKSPPVYALIFQREQDGTQADFGAETAPRPQWTFDASDGATTLRSPDPDLVINLYDYDPAKQGTNWFEAGLRSIRYKNLGGKCRRSAG